MPRNLDAIIDIHNAASEALSFVAEMTSEEFMADRRIQLAVLHLITVMGEATRRISAAFRIQNPELPWPKMLGMRNRLIHEYDDVDLVLVWDVLKNDLPQLLRRIQPLMPDQDGDAVS
jgi:uncharacterized protein with HEPN domain